MVFVQCSSPVFVFWIAFSSVGLTAGDVSMDAPLGLTDEGELVTDAGQDITITCRGDSDIRWTYPDYEDQHGVEVKTVNEHGQFVSTLSLVNANYQDTGYFHCFPAFATKESPLAHSVYVYVRDPENLFASNDTFQVLVAHQFSTLVIPCRPTDPAMEVVLTKDGEDLPYATYDPHRGFSLKVDSVHQSGVYECEAGEFGASIAFNVLVQMRPHQSSVDKPEIDVTPPAFAQGQNVTLTCSITVDPGIIAFLNWTVPNPKLLQSPRFVPSNRTSSDDKGKSFIVVATILKVNKEDEGEYVCNVEDSSGNRNEQTYTLQIADKFSIELQLRGHKTTEISVPPSMPKIELIVDVKSFPPAKMMTWHYNNHHIPLRNDSSDGILFFIKKTESKLTILNPRVNSSGVYSLVVDNGHHKKGINITVRVKGVPDLRIEEGKSEGHYLIGREYNIKCDVIAHPPITVNWFFTPCDNYPKCDAQASLIPREQCSELEDPLTCTLESTLSIKSTRTGVLKCEACNQVGCNSAFYNFLASDLDGPRADIMVQGPKEVVVSDNVTLKCAVSKYTYSSALTWVQVETNKPVTNQDQRTLAEDTQYSHVLLLNLPGVQKQDGGTYTCLASYLHNKRKKPPSPPYALIVKDPERPRILQNHTQESVMTGTQVKWNCTVQGTPEPTVTWYKDGKPVSELPGEKWHALHHNMTLVKHVGLEDDGEYECVASNKLGSVTAKYKLIIQDKTSPWLLYFFLFVVSPLVIVLVVIAIWFIRRSQRLKREIKELKAAGLLDFEKGKVECLNPELEIGEQADLLPYDKEKWEFPRDKLKLGKQLGSGAFGVVLKADAYELVEEGVATTVAVKMVKRNCDANTIKALVSELKIMIHLGKHVNVVNCLGACTDSINKRELLVMVEYCQYGNLHGYLQKHRGAFINQVNAKTGDFDPVLIQPVSPLSKNFPLNGDMSNGRMSVMTSGALSQATDTTLLSDMTQGTNTAGEAEETPLDDDGYELPRKHEWRNSDRGDYRSGLRPIYTQDLICWGFQIARGMEYLASRKVLHGDLAARNVLLADDNIVKICDFGLSRSMYRDNNYMKKGDGPLPVKWMAPESIRDRVFSSQSDVWSYGVTLWELFSLAVTPYPGIETYETLFTKLTQGYRMEQPKYATNQVYKVMADCWHKNPHSRPSFTELTERMGGMLEDSVRSHYVDLNDVYLKENSVYLTQRDYLSMLRSPTYTNWSPLPQNDYYIPMSPTRKEAEDAFELTPMLRQTSPVVSDSESTPNSPTIPPQPSQAEANIPDSPDSSPITKPKGNNYVNVMQLLSFSNPSYQNVGRPNKNPYVNMPLADQR